MSKKLTTWLTIALLLAEGSLIGSPNAWAGHRHRRCCPQPAACCVPPVAYGSSTASMTHNLPIEAAQATAPAPVPPEEKKSLYMRLGGEPAIKAVVDDFVGRAASNPKVNFTRAGSPAEWKATDENVAKLKKHLVQMVCAVSGGPQKYEGRDMKSSHAGMKITNAEFDAIAGDLIATLKKFNVPQAEIDELVGIVAGTRGDIVEVK